MPLTRRIVACGNTSRGVILPASWLAYAERQAGERIEEVTIECDGALTIRPYIAAKEAR